MPPTKVQELSVLLFMAVGFMNNVSAENRLLEAERSDLLQGQISAYISGLKNQDAPPRYPFEKKAPESSSRNCLPPFWLPEADGWTG